MPIDYCATIGEVWLQKGRCISSVVDRFLTSFTLFSNQHLLHIPSLSKSTNHRSLMEIPGLDPVREHFNLFPGTRESCIELLK